MKYTKIITKYVIPYLFCLLVGWVLAEFIAGYKLVPYPKWAVTIAIGAGLTIVLYVKKKSRKHTRDNEEYGSAKWGGVKDIKP
jgi:type IV secretion system protein VirD4